MTLTTRLLAELDRLGSATHPIARTLPGIIQDSARCARRVFVLALVVAFAAGFLVCYGWSILRLDAIRDRMDGIYLSCLNPALGKSVSRAQAQVLTQQIEGRIGGRATERQPPAASPQPAAGTPQDAGRGPR